MTAVSSHMRGMLYMLGAMATLSLMDVGLKQLAANYPSMQVAFLRGITSLPLLLLGFGIFGRWRDLAARRWSLHAMRAVLGVATLGFFVYSVSVLSLANAYAIFLCAPLLIIALSVPLLGERVDRRLWFAVCAGMAGVLVALRPSETGLLALGALAALAAAVSYALSLISIRMMAQTETSAATVLWSQVGITLLAGLAAWTVWQPLQWVDWPWLMLLGITGALGQHLITEAFRRAPPSVIAPLEYTQLGFGILFDWLLWTVAPNLRMLVGASIIVASGLYVIHRQTREQVGTPAKPARASS